MPVGRRLVGQSFPLGRLCCLGLAVYIEVILGLIGYKLGLNRGLYRDNGNMETTVLPGVLPLRRLVTCSVVWSFVGRSVSRNDPTNTENATNMTSRKDYPCNARY